MEREFQLDLVKEEAEEDEICGVSFCEKREKNEWYIDSVCTSHMSGNKKKLIKLKKEKGGDVSFGNDGTSKIMGKGRVALKGTATTQNVLYVVGLKHDLLSVGQMCYVGYNLTFYDKVCEIRRNGSKKVIGRGSRTPGNVYILDEIQGEKGYIGQTNEC